MLSQTDAMKKILLLPISLLISIASLIAQHAPASAGEIMKEAFATAKKQNKKVFVIFHASWCGWCHKMDTSLNDATVKKFFDDNFVIRHLVVHESKGKGNLENSGALDMLTKYNGSEQGIPFWIIFDKDENFLVDSRMRIIENSVEKILNTGCPASQEEVDYFISVLKQATPLKDDELEMIRIRFRKNELN